MSVKMGLEIITLSEFWVNEIDNSVLGSK